MRWESQPSGACQSLRLRSSQSPGEIAIVIVARPVNKDMRWIRPAVLSLRDRIPRYTKTQISQRGHRNDSHIEWTTVATTITGLLRRAKRGKIGRYWFVFAPRKQSAGVRTEFPACKWDSRVRRGEKSDVDSVVADYGSIIGWPEIRHAGRRKSAIRKSASRKARRDLSSDLPRAACHARPATLQVCSSARERSPTRVRQRTTQSGTHQQKSERYGERPRWERA